MLATAHLHGTKLQLKLTSEQHTILFTASCEENSHLVDVFPPHYFQVISSVSITLAISAFQN